MNGIVLYGTISILPVRSSVIINGPFCKFIKDIGIIFINLGLLSGSILYCSNIICCWSVNKNEKVSLNEPQGVIIVCLIILSNLILQNSYESFNDSYFSHLPVHKN